MDTVGISLVMYLGTGLALGVISNFQKPLWVGLASTLVVLGAFLLPLFSAPPVIFVLFFAAPYSVGRFSYQFVRHIMQRPSGRVLHFVARVRAS